MVHSLQGRDEFAILGCKCLNTIKLKYDVAIIVNLEGVRKIKDKSAQ